MKLHHDNGDGHVRSKHPTETLDFWRQYEIRVLIVVQNAALYVCNCTIRNSVGVRYRTRCRTSILFDALRDDSFDRMKLLDNLYFTEAKWKERVEFESISVDFNAFFYLSV